MERKETRKQQQQQQSLSELFATELFAPLVQAVEEWKEGEQMPSNAKIVLDAYDKVYGGRGSGAASASSASSSRGSRVSEATRKQVLALQAEHKARLMLRQQGVKANLSRTLNVAQYMQPQLARRLESATDPRVALATKAAVSGTEGLLDGLRRIQEESTDLSRWGTIHDLSQSSDAEALKWLEVLGGPGQEQQKQAVRDWVKHTTELISQLERQVLDATVDRVDDLQTIETYMAELVDVSKDVLKRLAELDPQQDYARLLDMATTVPETVRVSREWMLSLMRDTYTRRNATLDDMINTGSRRLYDLYSPLAQLQGPLAALSSTMLKMSAMAASLDDARSPLAGKERQKAIAAREILSSAELRGASMKISETATQANLQFVDYASALRQATLESTVRDLLLAHTLRRLASDRGSLQWEALVKLVGADRLEYKYDQQLDGLGSGGGGGGDAFDLFDWGGMRDDDAPVETHSHEEKKKKTGDDKHAEEEEAMDEESSSEVTIHLLVLGDVSDIRAVRELIVERLKNKYRDVKEMMAAVGSICKTLKEKARSYFESVKKNVNTKSRVLDMLEKLDQDCKWLYGCRSLPVVLSSEKIARVVERCLSLWRSTSFKNNKYYSKWSPFVLQLFSSCGQYLSTLLAEAPTSKAFESSDSSLLSKNATFAFIMTRHNVIRIIVFMTSIYTAVEKSAGSEDKK